MADSPHGNLVPGVASGIHVAPRWSVANAAGLAGLVVTAADVAGIALQLDTKKLYWLSSSAPVTWVPLGDADKTYVDSSVNVQAINDQTGTTYTVQASDLGKCIRLSNAAAITLAVPDTIVIPAGFRALIPVVQVGAGQITVVGSGTRALVANRPSRTNREGKGQRSACHWWELRSAGLAATWRWRDARHHRESAATAAVPLGNGAVQNGW